MRVCAALPAGCETEVRRLTHAEWLSILPLHRYHTMYQCDVLEFRETRFDSRVVSGLAGIYYPTDSGEYVLYLAIAGGHLISSCIVKEVAGGWWFVELLCSATHTGGGKQVIREIQRQVQNRGDKGIRLVSSAYAHKFYTSMGFNYNTDGLQYDREWTPNK